MNALRLLIQRRPSSGIHLLTDPFPERLNTSTTSLFTRAEVLSTQREFIASSGRLRMTTAMKK